MSEIGGSGAPTQSIVIWTAARQPSWRAVAAAGKLRRSTAEKAVPFPPGGTAWTADGFWSGAMRMPVLLARGGSRVRYRQGRGRS